MTSDNTRSRPAWLDSMAVVAVLVAAAAMWGYFTVAALVKGAYLLGVLDGLLLIATVWTTMLILRRRQRQDD